MYRYQRAVETGFTLIELMIVVVVIAILAAIAYPSYTNYVESARRSDGQATLLEVMQAEERHYTLNNTYTTDLVGKLGFAADPVESDEGWYDISAAACGSSALTQCVQLTAAPQGAQASDDCGSISLNSRGQWSHTGSASASECY